MADSKWVTGPGMQVALNSVAPYASLIILKCTAGDYLKEIGRIEGHLRNLLKSHQNVTRQVLGSTQPTPETDSDTSSSSDQTPPQLEGALIYSEHRQIPWLKASDLEDVTHGLAVWLSDGPLVAIRADGALAKAVQNWLDKAPRPPFERLPANLMQNVFLQGEIKGLWLKGAHPRRSTMPDSKYLSGPRLQDALNPLTDASFAPSAGRAQLTLNPNTPTVRQRVGCSPAKSSVWISPTASYDEFQSLARLVLTMVAEAITIGTTSPALGVLATRQSDLSGVNSAFAITTSLPDDLAPDCAPEMRDAASLLEGAELEVHGKANSPDFQVEVGLGGKIGGTLGCSVHAAKGRVQLSFGVRGTPTDNKLVRPVLDALEFTELVTVHYESGHTVTEAAAWSHQLAMSDFPKWEWHDFDGWDIMAEKPARSPEGIHSGIGAPGDRSLFSWVASHLNTGFLTCDDGPGEVADFVHVDHDDTLTLIHVKAAGSNHPSRRIAVQRYEGVVGQALKNVTFLATDALTRALACKRPYQVACWLDGERTSDRSEMLEYLSLRSRHTRSRVIVLQPHVRKAEHEKSWAQKAGRVRLLDALLNGARGTVTGLGAEFEVWGSA